MKVGQIYDQGTSSYREDGLVVTSILFGVFDGVSAPYAPKYPMEKFGDMSGAEKVSRFCEDYCHNSQALPLGELIRNLNENVIFRGLGFCQNHDAGRLPGATFAVAKVIGNLVRFTQAGDCLAVIELRSGKIIVSPNQVRRHDKKMTTKIERLQREVAQELFGLELEDVPADKRGQVRGEMWNRFYPILTEARRKNVNNPHSSLGYGLLNGQPTLKDMLWKKTFGRKDMKTVLLFTDGIVPWDVMKSADDKAIGKQVLAEFKQRGLAGLLLKARGIEEKTAAVSYMDRAEATAIALDFSDEK